MLSKSFTSTCLLSLLAIMASSTYASEPMNSEQPSDSKPKKEKICAIYPHLKDSYWLSVNYGMVSEAEKQQVELRVLEAGGYPNIGKQASQLVLCTQWGADAIILGTVSPDAYRDNLSDWVGNTPVFATVNELAISKEQQKVLFRSLLLIKFQTIFQ